MSDPFAALAGQFPILTRRVNGLPLTYLDSAASSLTPECVLEAETNFYRMHRANVHRGQHALSSEVSEAYESARYEIARWLDADASELVFTSGTTASLNLVARGLDLERDSEVITTSGEHHSTLLPFLSRCRLNALQVEPWQPLDPEAVRAAINPRTRAVVLAQASNITGRVQPIAEICRVAREAGVVSVIDAAQSAPHMRVSLAELGCDFLALSGHKLLGPTGIGLLVGRAEALEKLRVEDLGGGAVAHVSLSGFVLRPCPERLEPGTPNIAGALGLAAAFALLERLGMHNVEQHGRALRQALYAGLAELPGIRILGRPDAQALPIVSFLFPALSVGSDDLAVTLSDRFGIMLRSGQHCAHPMFAQLGLASALRASAYVYNSQTDIERLCASLRELLLAFG